MERLDRPRAVSSNILLVEDDASVRLVLDRILRRSGYDVTVAVDAVQAMELAEATRSNGSFDLAILNVMLPPPGSTAVVEVLRQVMQPLRVLVISGYDEPSVLRSGLIDALTREARYQFLQKPFELTLLLDSVEKLLDSDSDVLEIAVAESDGDAAPG